MPTLTATVRLLPVRGMRRIGPRAVKADRFLWWRPDMECEDRQNRGNHQWCSRHGAYTSAALCVFCNARGDEYIKDLFDRRDGRKPNVRPQPVGSTRKTQRRTRPKPLANIPPEAVGVCQNCHDSRACPNVSFCCGGKIVVNIVVPCPRDHWSLLEATKQEVI